LCLATSLHGSKLFPFTKNVTLDARGMIRETTQCFLYNLGCEKGDLQMHGDRHMAHYVNGQAHQKILAWNLLPTERTTREYDRFRIRVLLEGSFKGAAGDDECDIVVGVSDGKTVWALGRGDAGRDTLPPFPYLDHRRSAGHFYDVYAVNEGHPPQTGAFWIHVELADGAVYSKIWNQGAVEPSKMASYPLGEQNSNATRPWVSIAPMLGDQAILPSHGEVPVNPLTHPHGKHGPEDVSAPLVFLRRGLDVAEASKKPDALKSIVQQCKEGTLQFSFPSLKSSGGDGSSSSGFDQKEMAQRMGGSIVALRYPALFSNCLGVMVTALAAAGARAVLIIAPAPGSDGHFFLRQAAPLQEPAVPVVWLRTESGVSLEEGLCSADGGTDEEGRGGRKGEDGTLVGAPWSACRGKGGGAAGAGAAVVHATVSWGVTQNKQEEEADESDGEKGAAKEAKLAAWPRSWAEQAKGSGRGGDEAYPLPRMVKRVVESDGREGGVTGASEGGVTGAVTAAVTGGGLVPQDLALVVYRDDPPQSYAFENIRATVQLGGGGGGGREDVWLQNHEYTVDMNGNRIAPPVQSGLAHGTHHRPLTDVGSAVVWFMVLMLVGAVLKAWFSLCGGGEAVTRARVAEEEQRRKRQEQVQSLLLASSFDPDDDGL
jgi:hypothetical protein